jgi:hypothetical protein
VLLDDLVPGGDALGLLTGRITWSCHRRSSRRDS